MSKIDQKLLRERPEFEYFRETMENHFQNFNENDNVSNEWRKKKRKKLPLYQSKLTRNLGGN